MAGAENEGLAKKTKILIAVFVLIIASATVFWTLPVKPLNNHECYVSVTAREMIASGDWVVPTFNGKERLEKTPLSYWLCAATAMLTGKADELSARIPSAFFAILSAGAIMFFVSKWLGFRIAAIAALIWSTTQCYTQYGHSARPEMALCALVTIAMLSFYSAMQATVRGKQIRYMLIFWISFALAMLAKGPAPLPLVLPPIFFYFVVFRQWNKLGKTLPIIGSIIFLMIVLPWPFMVVARIPEGWAFWKAEFVDRFLGTHAPGNKPFYYYIRIMFSFMLPWAAFVPYGLISPFHKIWGKKQRTMLYLWLWFVVEVVVMTVSGGKRQHYILAAMPAMAILAAIVLDDMVFCLGAFTVKNARNMLRNHLVVIAIGLATFLTFIAMKKVELLFQASLLTAIAAIVMTLVAVLFASGKKTGALAALFVGYTISIMVAYVCFVNPTNYNNSSREFSKAAGAMVPDVEKLVAYKKVSARFVQYSGRRVETVKDVSEIISHYKKGSWILATGDDLDELKRNGQFEAAFFAEKGERQSSADVGAALLHKTANP